MPQGMQKSFARGFVSSLWGFSSSVARLITSDVLLFCFFNAAFRVTSADIKGLKPLWIFLKQHLQQQWAIHRSESNCTLQKRTQIRPGKTWQSSCFALSLLYCL